jgi:hypothetical protein
LQDICFENSAYTACMLAGPHLVHSLIQIWFLLFYICKIYKEVLENKSKNTFSKFFNRASTLSWNFLYDSNTSSFLSSGLNSGRLRKLWNFSRSDVLGGLWFVMNSWKMIRPGNSCRSCDEHGSCQGSRHAVRHRNSG